MTEADLPCYPVLVSPATTLATEPGFHLTRAYLWHHRRAITIHPRTGLIYLTAPEPAVIFLGQLYVLSEMPHRPENPDIESYCQGLDGLPDHTRLQAFLTLNPPSLRAVYQHCLAACVRREVTGHMPHWISDPLRFEHRLWTQHDTAWLDRHVEPYLDRVQIDTQEHWFWQRTMSTSRPVVAWRGTENVPVVRLLWHASRPMDLLLPNERLRKDEEICPDSIYRHCVNPQHFRHALRLTADQLPVNKRSTWERSGEARYKYHWTDRDIRWERHPLGLTYDVPVLYCPQGHRFSETIQRNVRDMCYEMSPNYRSPQDRQGWSRCPTCWDQLRAERGVDAHGYMKRRPRTLAQPNQQRLAEARKDQAYRTNERALQEGRYSDMVTEPGEFQVRGPLSIEELDKLAGIVRE